MNISFQKQFNIPVFYQAKHINYNEFDKNINKPKGLLNGIEVIKKEKFVLPNNEISHYTLEVNDKDDVKLLKKLKKLDANFTYHHISPDIHNKDAIFSTYI